jgi:hypothetical protein
MDGRANVLPGSTGGLTKDLDGRTIRGSIDDYWVAYLSLDPDPYIGGGWAPHAYGDAFGDYMKIGQSVYENDDGFGRFFTWAASPGPMTCQDMVPLGIADKDAANGATVLRGAAMR